MDRITRILLVIFFAFSLASCTLNPFTTDNRLTGDPLSTAVGAGVGAGTAYAFGGSQSVIAAAGIGGGLIGYYVSTLRFASGGVIQAGGKVFSLGKYITIDIPSDRLFEVNTSEFLQEAYPILDSAVKILKRYPDNDILVSGNTSGFGTTRFQLKLSEARARQVSAYLWAHGVSEFKGFSIQTRKLVYTGYGDFFPIANRICNTSIRQNSHIQITGTPTLAQLKMDRCFRIYGNVGGIDESCVPTLATGNYSKAPCGTMAPVQEKVSDWHQDDFRNVFNDSK